MIKLSKEKLKVGVIGCGNAAKFGHLPWYKQAENAEITAIADPDEKELKKVAGIYKIKKAYADPNDLLEDPEIDAVSICSPHWAHCQQTIRAANNRKHVLCEKPIGINLKEVDEMITAVEKNKIVFQTGTQKRFDPGFQMIKEDILEGKLGDIFHISVYWYYFVPDLTIPWLRKSLDFLKKIGIDIEKSAGGWRLTDERGGGGDLIDHVPHYYDLFRFWFGDIATISAQVRRVYKSRVFEDHGAMLLSFKDCDTVAVFERSQNITGRITGEESGRIHGTKGSYYFDVPHEYNLEPMEVKKKMFSLKNYIINRRKKVKIKFPKDKWNLGYAREIRSFINQCLGKSNEDVGFPEEWIPTIYDGRASLEGVLASYESSRTNQTIHLPLKSYIPIKWTDEK